LIKTINLNCLCHTIFETTPLAMRSTRGKISLRVGLQIKWLIIASAVSAEFCAREQQCGEKVSNGLTYLESYAARKDYKRAAGRKVAGRPET